MIDKTKIVATMTRSFFDAFFSGLLDSHPAVGGNSRQHLRRLAMDYYEHIAPIFSNVLTPLLLRLSNEDAEAVEADMRRRHFSDATPLKVLLRYACGSKQVFDVLTATYKQELMALLDGTFCPLADHLSALPETMGADVDEKRAIRSVVRTAMHAYSLGARSTGEVCFKQQTVLRLMPDAMAALLHDEPIDVWKDADADSLDAVYRRACKNADFYETLMEEMNRAYEDNAGK